jgi:hypothetical protein
MSKTAIVVTVGSPKESLGALKLAAWLRRIGYTVEERNVLTADDSGYDLYCFSCVFSKRLPELVTMAKWAVRFGETWIGGPAVTFHADNSRYVELETGVRPHKGIDERFERELGPYPMVYFSRGCPAYTPACGLCPVPRIEGNKFRYYPDATPAKLLLDNNLSALPEEYQDHIIERYRRDWTGTKVDANSGFEPHTFTEKTLLRWQRFPLQCWRFGYDDITERDQALEMMRLLKFYGYSGEKVRVYTMIGNEPIEVCVKRIREVIDNGFHPWPQRLRPLNWLGPEGTLPCRFDWDEPTLIAYQRFYSYAGLWKKNKPEDFYYQSRFPLRGPTTQGTPEGEESK